MRQRSLFLSLPLLLGLAGVGFTAEVDKNKQLDALTSFQLGDYSLEFEGGEPRKSTDLDNPPGLQSFKKDPFFSPFVGLKFSTPLKDDFFKAGH